MPDNSVRLQSPVITAMAEPWPLIDALMGGTLTMRKAGKLFLPQWPNEGNDAYKARLESTFLHPVFKRTVIINAARPFATPPVLEGINATIMELLDNIDMQGSTLPAFAMQVLTKALSKGLCGALVDCPQADGVKTKADEARAGIRPYVAVYPAESILGWRVGKVAGGVGLTQLRLLESITVDDGLFGQKIVEQVRVLTPGAWQIWQPNPKVPQDWIVTSSGSTKLDFIPFVFFYGVRTSFGLGVSPLLDLASQNQEHWISASDQNAILHVARVPILFAKKFGDAQLTIGAGSACSSDEDGAELTYVEHSGAAIDAGRISLTDLEDRMRATGGELIQPGMNRTTATQVNSEGEVAQSLLQQIVEVFEESLEQIVNYMGAWLSIPTDCDIQLYKDYGTTLATDPANLVAAKVAGVISAQTAFEELQRRNTVSPDRTWAEEQERLDSEAPEVPPESNPKDDSAKPSDSSSADTSPGAEADGIKA